jgi:hypothetical protein
VGKVQRLTRVLVSKMVSSLAGDAAINLFSSAGIASLTVGLSSRRVFTNTFFLFQHTHRRLRQAANRAAQHANMETAKLHFVSGATQYFINRHRAGNFKTNLAVALPVAK